VSRGTDKENGGLRTFTRKFVVCKVQGKNWEANNKIINKARTKEGE
jgi:hypothetical protein